MAEHSTDAVVSDPGSSQSERPLLWFERVIRRLRLPLLPGVFLVIYLPYFLGLAAGYAATGLWDNFVAMTMFTHIPALITFLTSVVGSRYICDRMERLRTHAQGIVEDGRRIDLSGLYSFRPILVIWILLSIFGNTAFWAADAASYSPAQIILSQVSTWPIYLLVVCTILWVWGYSLVAIYRMGGLPLRLTSFTEDRMLGLAPFAKESLRITAVYLFLIGLQAGLQIFSGEFSVFVSLLFLPFFPLGLAFFLLPLLPLRRKLRQAKAEKLRWINCEYSKVLSSAGPAISEVDERVAGRLLVVDKVRCDVHNIRTWPFETGIMARLTAVVVSVTAILLSTIIRIAIGI